MKNFKTKFLLFSLLSCSLGHSAQTKISYSYDAAGNRVKREILMSKTQNQAKQTSASFSDMVADRQIKISPNNPTKGNLRIEVADGTAFEKGEVEVYSLGGIKITSAPTYNKVAVVDISQSTNGIYILRVSIDGSSTSWKIIKE